MKNQLSYQIQQLQSLESEKSRLEVELSKKRTELGNLNREIEQANFKLNQTRKSLGEDTYNLSTKISTLRTLNSTADFMNKRKVQEFRTLRDVIGELEGKYNRSKHEIEDYKLQEINRIHAEVNTERIKLFEEAEELDRNKETVSKLIRSLNEKISLYKDAVDNTASLQKSLKIDYANVQKELNGVTIKKSQLERLATAVNSIYEKANDELNEIVRIRTNQDTKAVELNTKLANVSNMEKKILDEIYRKGKEINLKKQELLQIDDDLRIRKLQLDDRQQVLESAFQELRQLKSSVL